MEKRRFGRTGHMSTVAILGGAAFKQATQTETDTLMERVIAAGVNHIDVAPSYGVAEERLGPWLSRERARFFLGCKTLERSKEGAITELHHSLERLRVTSFDLYQLHAVTSMDELDRATQTDGALDGIITARGEGLTRFIGITSHGMEAPAILLEALHRFDFDSVLFPVNARLYADPTYRRNAEKLIHYCHARDVGIMAIKAVAKAPWGERPKRYTTWYEPFDDGATIQKMVNFALSQGITGLCTPADLSILPLVLDACAHATPMDEAQQEALIAHAAAYESVFA